MKRFCILYKVSNTSGHRRALVLVDFSKSRGLAGKTDKGVSDAMDALDIKYFTHAAAAAGVVHAIVEAGVMVLSGINPVKPFTNMEKPILSVLNVGGSIANAIRVNGFTSAHLPKEWTNIIVTNLSGTDPGSFEVFMK